MPLCCTCRWMLYAGAPNMPVHNRCHILPCIMMPVHQIFVIVVSHSAVRSPTTTGLLARQNAVRLYWSACIRQAPGTNKEQGQGKCIYDAKEMSDLITGYIILTMVSKKRQKNKKTDTANDSLLPAFLGRRLFHRWTSQALGWSLGCR
jgi:hypothetical protein